MDSCLLAPYFPLIGAVIMFIGVILGAVLTNMAK